MGLDTQVACLAARRPVNNRMSWRFGQLAKEGWQNQAGASGALIGRGPARLIFFEDDFGGRGRARTLPDLQRGCLVFWVNRAGSQMPTSPF